MGRHRTLLPGGFNRPAFLPGFSSSFFGDSDAVPTMAGVAQDATSSKFLPATAGQWTTTLTFAGVTNTGPSAIWLLQDASGNPADVLGAFPLTAAGTLAYQQTVTGWTAKGINTTAGSPGGTLISTAAGLPSINTNSALLLAYVQPQADITGASRTLMGLGTTFDNDCSLHYNVSDQMFCKGATNVATSGADTATGVVRPYVLKIDRTGGVIAGYSDAEKLAPAIGGTGKRVLLGGANVQELFSMTASYVYAALFINTAAEISDADVKKILQALGWTVAW